MNRYIGGGIRIISGSIKSALANCFSGGRVRIHPLCTLDPTVELTVDQGAKCAIGRRWNARSGSILRVRKGAEVTIGKNFNLSTRSIITARDKIEIGDNVTFGPGVLMYDHDHDFRAHGGAKSGKYKTSPIKIGNNVWIGAGSVILRGACIADNCVVAAGTIVRGSFAPNSLIYQHRDTRVKAIEMGEMESE